MSRSSVQERRQCISLRWEFDCALISEFRLGGRGTRKWAIPEVSILSTRFGDGLSWDWMAFGIAPMTSDRILNSTEAKIRVLAKNKPWKCRTVESMESHSAGFPPFPQSLEIPAGIPTLPRLRLRLSCI